MRVWDGISRVWRERSAALSFARSWRGGVVLVALCLTVYLPGLFTIPPIDRDESRFAQASRQMFEAAALAEDQKNPAFHSGGWVVPMVQDRARLNKPPLVYWVQVASAWVFTGGDPLKDEIWMYRVPGVVCAILTVLMTWRMGMRMFDARAAWVGACLLAVCPLIVFDAHQARADQLLLTTVVGMQWGLWGVWRGARATMDSGQWTVDKGGEGKSATTTSPTRWRGSVRGAWGWALMFWVCLGLSVLTKGPIGPMIVALTCVALSLVTRSWRWMGALKPAVGIVIVAAMVGPWVWAVGEHVGWEKYLSIVRDETIGRSLEAREGHWGPPGYHTVLLAVLFWPGSLTTAMGIGRAFRRALVGNPERERRATAGAEVQGTELRAGASGGAARLWRAVVTAARRLRYGFPGRGAELFLIAWIVPAWVVFELIGTKLPHYVMPMYPAVALLSGRGLLSLGGSLAREASQPAFRVGSAVWAAIGCGLASVLAVVLIAFAIGVVMWTRTRATAPELVMAASLCIGSVVSLFAAGAAIRAMGCARRLQWPGAVAREFTVAVVCWLLFLAFLAPRVLPGAATVGIASAIARAPGASERAIGTTYHEDSIIFATRGRAVRISADELDSWWASHPDGVVVASLRDLKDETGGWPVGAEVLPPMYSAWQGSLLGSKYYAVVRRQGTGERP